MDKKWKQPLLISLIFAFATGAFALDSSPIKEAPKPPQKGPTFTICALPFNCGTKGGKRFDDKKNAPKPIKLGTDPLSKAILAEPGVTTAMRVNGKIVYVQNDESLALPESALPSGQTSPTSEADETAFQTVNLKTAAAAQANEMSERTAKVGESAADSKTGAAKAFGLGEKPKS
ncbi:MAG: hypothetical protein AUJ52_10600 [Elusimicrobia bacterium CG1_02_63_36]|nr:MAG: hypothetical protein AUJ52_10600 [Elusimicrobia bacterium CG1_02_63_36]PIP83976.1 MAG: hypothetical protein COR54_06700 [Elusimicrobia bacterium CG22_combo_CG10-13_8_21_14_all_63_91]PJA17273.1 MAG: hypothetical protein COX66_05150 [Elusimicrobia bacterium CG_4_10_14_0_2_um_filter_63_34]PJB23846.1 MAG: hypothetical protein CO113_16515 [Elusimicrobia bacterium CG_4_9_14_3_um_filter_62_55]